MKYIIMLLINGNKFLFRDPGLTIEQKAHLELLTEKEFKINSTLKKMNKDEINFWFVNTVKENFGVETECINISYIIRLCE